jgi:hypothetical protein
VCLVRVARAFRAIIDEYTARTTEVTIMCANRDETLQRLALSLLDRCARSLYSITLCDDDAASVVPEHGACVARVITRNAATLRHVSVNILETYLAACACPKLEGYHPFNHGTSSLPFNRHALHTATVACRHITRLVLDEQHLLPLTIDRILSAGPVFIFPLQRGFIDSRVCARSRRMDTVQLHVATIWRIRVAQNVFFLPELMSFVYLGVCVIRRITDAPLSLTSLGLKLRTDYNCVKRAATYFETLTALTVACADLDTYIDARQGLYEMLATVLPMFVKLRHFTLAVPLRKQTQETQRRGLFAMPVVWHLAVLETLTLENVESLEPFELVAPRLQTLECTNTCAIVFSDIIKHAVQLRNVTRVGTRRMPRVDAFGAPTSTRRILLQECDGRQLQNAIMSASALTAPIMARVAERWSRLVTMRCCVQQACVATQRAICNLLRNAPHLELCVIHLYNAADKTHAPFSVDARAERLPPRSASTASPVDRPHLVKFYAPVPFEMFRESVRTPNLKALRCCVPRRLDETFRAQLPSLTDLVHNCSIHNHSNHPALSTSSLRAPRARGDGAGDDKAGSNVETLALGDADLMIATALSWCPRLHTLHTFFASELTFWELLRCGLSSPRLRVIRIGGAYKWADVKPLIPRLITTFPCLERLDCSDAEDYDEDERVLMLATISSLTDRPFVLDAIERI